MKKENKGRKIVIINQAANYLTVGLCNAFAQRMESVGLITGNIHEQGEELSQQVSVSYIDKYTRESQKKKYLGYLTATIQIYFLLLVRYRKYEVFFLSTPPMAYLLSIFLPQKTSMLIWDVYPDVLKVTGMKETHLVFRAWSFFNKVAFRKAFRFFTIGNRMARLLRKYVDENRINVTPIWSIFQSNGRVKKEENPFVIQEGLQDKFIVQYSGNIGLTHNVEVLIEIAERMKEHEQILFQIIGKGDRVPFLKQTVKQKGLKNCVFLPFQADEMFPYSLSAADLGVVILDERVSKGSVPSKTYNLMSFGIPSLYIASGNSELHDYVQKYNHAKCFQVSDITLITNFIYEIYRNEKIQRKYSKNALKASLNYKKDNADKIVELYLSE